MQVLWRLLYRLLQVRSGRGATEERDARNDEHAEGVAQRAQEEPVPDEGGEDHAGHHHQDDVDAGLHVVRQRPAAAQEGEQNDLGTEKPRRGRRQQQRWRHRRQEERRPQRSTR